MALGGRSAAGLCSASQAKRHSGLGPSAQTLGVAAVPSLATRGLVGYALQSVEAHLQSTEVNKLARMQRDWERQLEEEEREHLLRSDSAEAYKYRMEARAELVAAIPELATQFSERFVAGDSGRLLDTVELLLRMAEDAAASPLSELSLRMAQLLIGRSPSTGKACYCRHTWKVYDELLVECSRIAASR